jgi:Mg2+ and Co2+ transporter CorA
LFEAKQLERSCQYHWIRFSLVVSWLASTNQTRIFIIEAPAGFITTMSKLISDGLRKSEMGDPFWAVEKLVNNVVGVCDRTVWAVRNKVRSIEMLQMPLDRKPSPNYRDMHDLARHAIHVSESLAVSLETVGSIIRRHDDLLQARPDHKPASVGKAIHARLQFMENILHSLRYRSDSNQQRLLNEIQLAFHTVAQYDSKISVEITQSDSTAMRTVAFVTLSALPATFVSSIFSMSFFNFDPGANSGFISDKFWIFWAITVPLTIGISVLCAYTHIVPSIGSARRLPN